jgi:DNA-binding transcriptional LysR family regulator
MHDADEADGRRPSLRELEILRAMIATRKTVAAATALGISQPAVSRAIASLELRVGRMLFTRDGGRLVPTSDAFALEAEAAPIFTGLDRLATWPNGPVRAGLLKIAASPTLAQFLLPAAVAQFRELEPDITVQVEIGNSASVIASGADRAADLGIVDIMPVHPGVRAEILRESVAHLLMPDDHPLAAHARITPRELIGEPFIALARRFPSRFEVDKAFGELGLTPRIVAEAATSAFVAALVRTRVGVALINPFPLTLGGLDGLTIRPFDPAISYRTTLVFPTAGSVAPAARRFADMLRASQPEDGVSTPVR